MATPTSALREPKSRPQELRVGGIHVEVREPAAASLSPVVFSHGLGGCADDCRPWTLGLPATSALLELRGHGRSEPVPTEGWGYDTFAIDIASVADRVGARNVVGVSVGAGGVLQILANQPSRFEKVVLALPAVMDQFRSDASTQRLYRIADLASAHAVEEITAMLLSELPAEVADSRLARVWARRRAGRLASAPPPLPRPQVAPPVADRTLLSAVTADVLVLAERDDPLHPLEIAEEVAGCIPGARLEVFPHGHLHWIARDDAARVIASHLAD